MIDEEVGKLSARFSIDSKLKTELCIQMKRRSSTFSEDLKSLTEILEGSKNPNDHLRVAIHEMKEGTFDCGVVPKGSTSARSRSRSGGRPKPDSKKKSDSG